MWKCIALLLVWEAVGQAPEEAARLAEEAEAFLTAGPEGGFAFWESFQSDWKESGRWVISENEKYKGAVEWAQVPDSVEGDMALWLNSTAAHHAVSTKFNKPVTNEGTSLVVQYEVRLTKGLDCGGAYIKLFTHDDSIKLADFHDQLPYTIMFGPDKCGGTNKVHFIFRYTDPKGKVEEKHFKTPPSIKADKLSHLYTLVVRPDNSFEILIDQESVSKGNLLEDFSPAVNPPAKIDDPDDKKPADWVDEAKIPDETASKPEDWDEDAPQQIEDAAASKPSGWLDDGELLIPDPSAQMPSDWSEDEDGEWEAPKVSNPACSVGCGEWKRPMIPNPEYKGKWVRPMIDNADYKGEWKPQQIDNPDFFVEEHPSHFSAIGGIGIEIWTMSNGIAYDNLLVTHDETVAAEVAAKTWKLKSEREKTKAKSGADDGLLSSLGAFYDESPVLVISMAVVSVLGIVFLVYSLCCSSSPPPKIVRASDATAAKKNEQPETAAAAEAVDEDEDTAAAEPAAEKTKENKELRQRKAGQPKPSSS